WVAERVVADLVALGDGAGEDLLAALDRLAQHEEGAAAAVPAKQVEDVGRLRPRPVVERERNQAGRRRALRHDAHGWRARSVSASPSASGIAGCQPRSRRASAMSRQLRARAPSRAGRCSGVTSVPATRCDAASRSITSVSVWVPMLKAWCGPS